jgi:hypothetical protein
MGSTMQVICLEAEGIRGSVAVWLVCYLVGWLFACLFSRSFSQFQGAKEAQVGKRLYNVKLQNLLYISITPLIQQLSLFAEDVDLTIGYDFDLVRRTAQGKEYMLPKNFILTLDAKGMTVHLENLFNGNKLLSKLV